MANEIKFTQGSRNEAILREIINKLNNEAVGELPPPRSRIEVLLQEVLDKIGDVDPEVIVDAVYDWLDEHPEATTTVEDGAISYAKLNSSLKGTVDDVGDLKSQTAELEADMDYALITSETELGSSHDDITGVSSVYIQKDDDFSFGTPIIYNAINPLTGIEDTGVANGLAYSVSGTCVKFSGTSGTDDTQYKVYNVLQNPYEEGSQIKVVLKSNAVLNTAFTYLSIYIETSGPNYYTSLNTPTKLNGTDYEWTYTLDKKILRVSLRVKIGNSVVVPDMRLWFGIFPATYQSINTSIDFSEIDNYTYENNQLLDFNAIETAQYKSKAIIKVATKNYVDNHIPSIDFDEEVYSREVYLSPEMYGALGNGTNDDTIAVQSCINAAISQNKAVRGFGVYKTTGTISIDGSNLDIFLKRINYTGDSTAVSIAGKGNLFAFDVISATTSDSAKGISIVDPTSTDDTERIVIRGQTLMAKSNALYITTLSYILYTVCQIKQITSNLSDAIATSSGVGELAIYDARFSCANGWCVNGDSVKLFNCTMESNCYGGVYAKAASLNSCRYVELMDCLLPGSSHYGISTGIVIKAKSIDELSGISLNGGMIYYDAIDLSDIEPYKSSTDGSKSSIYNHKTGIINARIQYGDLNYRNGHYCIGSSMLLHGKDRICIPPFRSKWTITNSDFDLRDEAFETFSNPRPPFVTDFVVGVDNCVIRLSPSYCAEGFSDITIDMSQYLATVYDRRGNVIFDPTGKTLGKYRLTAIVDHTVDTEYQFKNSTSVKYAINSGYCDVWDVTKIS